MKISVNGDREMKLSLPSGLILNPFTASMLPKFLSDYGITVTAAQARQLVKTLNRYRKDHPEWVLVEVHSAQGEEVLIKL